jgi:hypothetical protein
MDTAMLCCQIRFNIHSHQWCIYVKFVRRTTTPQHNCIQTSSSCSTTLMERLTMSRGFGNCLRGVSAASSVVGNIMVNAPTSRETMNLNPRHECCQRANVGSERFCGEFQLLYEYKLSIIVSRNTQTFLYSMERSISFCFSSWSDLIGVLSYLAYVHALVAAHKFTMSLV